MKCPVCGIDLRITDRQGVKIDYCTQYRGVWLDRGELDKIIERSATIMPESRSRENNDRRYNDREEDDRYDSDRGNFGGPRRKRRSFLDDLFDFD